MWGVSSIDYLVAQKMELKVNFALGKLSKI